MRNEQKSKSQLLQEVETLRHRVAVLEKAKDITERKKGEEELLFKSTLLEAQSET